VARAKRTDRAEARRRYRATFADPIEEGDLEADAEGGATGAAPATRGAAVTRTRAAASSQPAAATPRPGVGAAFRSSFRPLDLRGDLRALPQIVTHWSLYVPVILAGIAVASVPFFMSSPLAGTLFGYFSGPAPFGTAFIAGLFAPRASYLVGMLAALASVGFMALAFAVGPFGGALDGMKDVTTGAPLSEASAKSILLTEALFTGVPLAALVAAAGAWYRRFLNRANPNRARRTTPTSRRPDGKVPKKPQQRPMLARRR
jgi:hypothetical protein